MSAAKSVRELFGSRYGELCFIVGMGPSLKNAELELAKKHPRAFVIAINQAIETVPADYWFWMDEDAYRRSKDHPNAKAAIRCGVDLFKDHYDPETYLWERAGNPDKIGPDGRRDFEQDIKDGKLAWSGVSVVGSTSLAWNLGAYRIVYVGCENKINEEYLKLKKDQDIAANGKVTKNWRSIYLFTFARINEALMHRDVWMPKKVMLVDASHSGPAIDPPTDPIHRKHDVLTAWGDLKLPKTTIQKELEALDAFYQHLWATGNLPKQQQLIARN